MSLRLHQVYSGELSLYLVVRSRLRGSVSQFWSMKSLREHVTLSHVTLIIMSSATLIYAIQTEP